MDFGGNDFYAPLPPDIMNRTANLARASLLTLDIKIDSEPLIVVLRPLFGLYQSI